MGGGVLAGARGVEFVACGFHGSRAIRRFVEVEQEYHNVVRDGEVTVRICGYEQQPLVTPAEARVIYYLVNIRGLEP